MRDRARREGRRRGPALGRAALAAVVVLLSGFSVLLLRRRGPPHPVTQIALPDLAPWETMEETRRVLPPADYERHDMRFGALLLGGVGTLAALLGMLGLALWIYPDSVPDKQIATPLPRFPSPQLQPNPPYDLADLRARQLGLLQNAYWLDRQRGVVHMPIADAMRDVARRGIPDWPTGPVPARPEPVKVPPARAAPVTTTPGLGR